MPNWVLALICLISGASAVGTGALISANRWQRAQRVRSRHARMSAEPDGWRAWFVRGFADLSAGAAIVSVSIVMMGWALLGLWLAGLGLYLVL